MNYNHGESDTMSCMVCGMVFTSIKADTCKKHISRKHPQIEGYSKARKQAIALKFERDLVKQKDKLNEYLTVTPMELCEMAPYKQAYIVCYHKHSFTTAEHMAEFAMCADPTSDVFENMASSRKTMVRRLEIISEFIKDELSKKLERALFWSVILDEATNKGRVEQVVFLVQFVDNEQGKI